MAIEDGLAVLDMITDKATEFCQEQGKAATKLRLPTHLAWQLVKAREHLGPQLLTAIRKHGARAFAKKGLYGLKVELVFGKDAEIVVE